jgi:tetratricopeptide (TPR) repeat protein
VNRPRPLAPHPHAARRAPSNPFLCENGLRPLAPHPASPRLRGEVTHAAGRAPSNAAGRAPSNKSFCGAFTKHAVLACILALGACGGVGEPATPKRSPLAEKWLLRAKQAYKTGDFDDAKASSAEAFRVAPHDGDVRLVGARVALARLDFAEAIRMTEGLTSPDGYALRGRAHWYAGDLEQAADDLEAELQDPAVKDPWARDVAKLARGGTGRHPFAIEGGIVGLVDMPPAGSALIVPCELDGERVLAMIATGSSEVVVDTGARKEPQWVSLRFGDRVEIKDVPALPQDLSPLSRQVGGTIKVLLGVNLLRHAHATFDRRGSQFVVRAAEASAPPDASRVPLFYAKGGGMLMRVAVSAKDDGSSLLYVDSSQAFSLALDDSMWTKAGVNPGKLQSAPNMPAAKTGSLPSLRLGGFDFPGVPAFSWAALGDHVPAFDIDVGGVLGAALLELFRVTFADDGRFVWLEPDPTIFSTTPPPPPPAGAAPGPSGPPLVLPPPTGPGKKP